MWRCATSRGGCAPVSSACSSTRVAAPASTVCAVPFLPRTGHGVPHNSALSFASNSRLSCLASGSSAVEAATAEATSPQEQPEPAVAAEDWAAEIEETLKLVRLLPPSGEAQALRRAVCCLCHVEAAGRYGGSPGSSVLSVMQPACLPHARPSAVFWCSA